MNAENNKPTVTFDHGILTISGTLTSATVETAEKELSPYNCDDIKVIDGSGISSIDTSGAVFINSIAHETVRLRGFSENIQKLLTLSKPAEKKEPEIPEKPRPMTLERFGGIVLREIERITGVAILLSDILFWSIVGLYDRSQYRKGSFTEQAFQMGSTALPIVGTILFLIGAISTLQSADTLKSFGASIFVVDMLALGMAREMAPLMTAIIISGRSGSAIASEIATMKFTEELDAIKTMGLNPIRFVVVPKMWAMVVCLPLLSIMALGFGILGGFVIGITYIGLSPSTFINRLVVTLFFRDIATGLFKSVSYAIIITFVGTYRGFRFTGGADGVGRATTMSVVTAIFAIIFADAIWSIILYF